MGKMLLGLLCILTFASSSFAETPPQQGVISLTSFDMQDNKEGGFAGDSEGNLYYIQNASCEKLYRSLCGEISSIAIGSNPGVNFYFASKTGRVFAFSASNAKKPVIPLYTGDKPKITGIIYDNNTLYGYSSDRHVYRLLPTGENNLSPVKISDMEANRIIKKFEEKNDKDYEITKRLLKSVNNVEIAKTGFLNKKQQVKSVRFAPIPIIDEQSGSGTQQSSTTTEEERTTASVDYVSEAGDGSENGIYRVTIKMKTLNITDLFEKGVNGIRFELSDEKGQNRQNAYPILGGFLSTNNTDSFNLNIRKISFLWAGPKCSSEGEHKLKINTFGCVYKDDKINQNIGDEITVDLPAALSINYRDFKIKVLNEQLTGADLSIYNTETCAVPFIVSIINDQTSEALPPDDEAYNHLVFYVGEGNDVKKGGVIGCDPLSLSSEYIAILPADCVEIPGGYVKYGNITKNLKAKTGKIFFAFAGGSPGMHKIYVGFVSDKQIIIRNRDLINLSVNEDASTLYPDTAYQNSSKIFQFTNNTLCSNWQGNKYGNGGYIDFALHNESEHNGIFFFLPEGLNTRTFDKRKNLCKDKLTIGYYFNPTCCDKSPLWATKYTINDTTSYSDNTRGKELYAILFNQYGKYGEYSMTDRNAVESMWGSIDDNMRMVVSNRYNVPVIMGATSSSRYVNGVTQRGLFVPPTSIPYYFMTGIGSRLDTSNDGYYEVECDSFVSVPEIKQCSLFKNSLIIDEHSPSGSYNFRITTNITESASDGLKFINNSSVTGTVCSLNSIAFYKAYSCRANLKLWEILYLSQKDAANYASSRGFRSQSKIMFNNPTYYGEYMDAETKNYGADWDWSERNGCNYKQP